MGVGFVASGPRGDHPRHATAHTSQVACDDRHIAPNLLDLARGSPPRARQPVAAGAGRPMDA